MVEIETFAMTLQQSIPGIKVTIDPDELRNYSIDGILARMVATPANAKQVALVTALANQQDLTVLARGGGSHIELGDIPERIDMMIETIQLTHLLEHEAPDLTCHVEAGLSLAAL